MTGTYNYFLVALSVFISSLAGYCTLELSARTKTATKRHRPLWLVAGAFTAGTGIWSMHFIGMMAFRLPISLGYDYALTALSWTLPVVTSWLALVLVQKKKVDPWQWIGGPALMGAAIVGMHYTGIAAMKMEPAVRWNPELVALSAAIAIVMSGLALWGARHVVQSGKLRAVRLKIAVGFVFGAAISLMHYTPMAAASFPENAVSHATNALSSKSLPGIVAFFSIFLLMGAASIANFDRRRIEHKKISETDSLTGLKNRRFLQTHLPEMVRVAEMASLKFHLAFVDLDGFKLINDTIGHDAGDKVLVIVAKRIKECLRDKDEVVRVGGDEFVVMLQGTDERQVEAIMQRIVSTLQDPIRLDDDTLRISASVGVARHTAGQDYQPLLMMADTAMYHAKREGKNRWKHFTPKMDEERLHAAETHRQLEQAFERKEFKLFYQPKYAAHSRTIVGVEALVRWIDPRKGMRLPAEFIGAAERSGLIVALGDWVLNEACRQIKEWRKRGWVMPVAVNVSALQVREHIIAQKVKDALEHHAIDAASLTLEVTESVGIADPLQAMQVFEALRQCGVAISIDDFGTGYSSLAYLRDFPAAEIKIDRAFVRDIATNRQMLELVRAIVAMGHALGMLVVAEGVEDEVTTELLERLNCDVLQGFHLGRPMDSEALATLVEQGGRLRPD